MKLAVGFLLSCILMAAGQVVAAPAVAPARLESSAEIISPDVADGFLKANSYSRFPDTGALAVCMEPDGRCEAKEWLTPQQAIAKRFPKATYVGFKVIRYAQSELEVLIFYRSKP